MKLLRPVARLMLATSLVYAAQNVTVSPGSTSIVYSDTNAWNTLSTCGGTYLTHEPDAYFVFEFVGTAIYVVGTTGVDGGVVAFHLNGNTSTQFDRYSAQASGCNQMMFAKEGLPNGSHTLTATLIAELSPGNLTSRHPSFEYQYITYTEFDSTGGGTSPSTDNGKGSKGTAAAVGGGVAGGVIALLILGFAIWYYVRHYKRPSAAAARANRPELDPSHEGSSYSLRNPFETPRLSQDAAASRLTLSKRPPSVGAAPETDPTPWVPDTQLATNLAPTTPTTGAPEAEHATNPVPHVVYPPIPAALPQSDVDRIAARVADIVLPQLQRQQPDRVADPESIEHTASPPPMYELRREP